MADLQHTDSDAAIVSAQLGRPARGRWAVARRCHLGVPMVIESHPLLEDGSPFPTLFWLTCPMLVKRASRLEADGRMTEYSTRLRESETTVQSLTSALERYRARRDEHAAIAESGGPPGGGPDRVKCLHAHVAHELADPPNPVGAQALAEVGWPDCRQPCFGGTE
jgi:uncharacterized protein